MARPDKNKAAIIKKRDELIFKMDKKGYPLDYIASFWNLTKGRVVQIIKSEKRSKKGKSKKNG